MNGTLAALAAFFLLAACTGPCLSNKYVAGDRGFDIEVQSTLPGGAGRWHCDYFPSDDKDTINGGDPTGTLSSSTRSYYCTPDGP